MQQLKFYIKFYKPKYFWMIFHLLKHYEILQIFFTFSSLEFIESVLMIFVHLVFVTVFDTLSAAFILSTDTITEISAILFSIYHSHKYMC